MSNWVTRIRGRGVTNRVGILRDGQDGQNPVVVEYSDGSTKLLDRAVLRKSTPEEIASANSEPVKVEPESELTIGDVLVALQARLDHDDNNPALDRFKPLRGRTRDCRRIVREGLKLVMIAAPPAVTASDEAPSSKMVDEWTDEAAKLIDENRDQIHDVQVQQANIGEYDLESEDDHPVASGDTPLAEGGAEFLSEPDLEALELEGLTD